jgi:hypothetical protein
VPNLPSKVKGFKQEAENIPAKIQKKDSPSSLKKAGWKIPFCCIWNWGPLFNST